MLFLLIILLLLSGCTAINTKEKQICLTTTHYSTTSIPNCSSQYQCYNKVKPLLTISSNLPTNIYSDIVSYSNNIASADYYFNRSKSNLERINNTCDTNKPKNLISAVNDLFYYLDNIFTYIDFASNQSIQNIKDLVIYFNDQNIDLISEEDIYSDYILLNNNLNELHKTTNKHYYITELQKNADTIDKAAENFGFSKTYVPTTNFVDLTNYYYNLTKQSASDIKVPDIVPGLNYTKTQLSNIEAISEINYRLNNSNNYNLYILLDRFIGNDNSVFIRYTELNNRINKDLDETYNKIYDLENKILENKNYLTKEQYIKFKNMKLDFSNKQIGFGYYLYKLKELNTDIKINKITENKINQALKDNNCEETINKARKYNNIYFSELITNYNNSKNLITKEEICNKLKAELNTDCFDNLNKIYNTNISLIDEYYFINPKNKDECINLLNTINYKLENYNQIILLNKIISENLDLIYKLRPINTQNYSILNNLNNYLNEINNIKNIPNYKKVINIEEKINNQKEMNNDLKEICKFEINKLYTNIIYLNKKYYLEINNPFGVPLTNIKIDSIDVSNIKFKNNNYKHRNILIIPKIYASKNYFEITYENTEKITNKISYLSLDRSLIKTTITNNVIGINSRICFDNNIVLLDDFNNSDDCVNYITKNINEIKYLEELFSKEITTNTEKITNNQIITTQNILIRNIYLEDIKGLLFLENINKDSIVTVKINNKLVKNIVENNKLFININIKKDETQTITIKILNNKQDINLKANQLLVTIAELKNSIFLDIKNDANYKFKDINISNKNNFTITEINQLFSLEPMIQELKNKLIDNKLDLSKFNKLYIILKNENVEKYNAQIYNLNKNKLKNIKNYYKQLKEIQNEIDSEKIKENNNIKMNNILEINKINKLITDYNLQDTELIDKLNYININKDNNQEFIEINNNINKLIKDKADNLNKILNNLFKELNTDDLSDLINNTYYLFEDFTLQELFSVNYYPPITKKDVERFEKKQKFLDTVKLSSEINDFYENYNSKNYKKAIDSLSTETLNRIYEIYNEKKLITDGVDKIKIDAKNELNKFIKNTPKNQKTIELENLAKTDYNNGKYLNTITLIRENNTQLEKEKSKIPLLTTLIIFVILLLLYFYYKQDKKQKENNKLSDIKKVIRYN